MKVQWNVFGVSTHRLDKTKNADVFAIWQSKADNKLTTYTLQ